MAPPLPDASGPSSTIEQPGPEVAVAELAAEVESQLDQPPLRRFEPMLVFATS